MPSCMHYIIKNKKTKGNKNLSSKKNKLLLLTPKTSRVGKEQKVAHLAPHRSFVTKPGRRKIKKLVATTNRGPLYTTTMGEIKKVHLTTPAKDAFQPAVKGAPLGLFIRKKRAFSQHRANGKKDIGNKNKVRLSFKYTTPLLTILQNKLMYDGRKGPAEKMFLKFLKELNYSGKKGAGYRLFYIALDRLKPSVGTVVRRVGRNYYQIPIPLKRTQQYKLAFQWLLESAYKNLSVPLYQSLAQEILTTVSSSQSESLKKKEALYRSVITNRAYSHYR